MEMTKKVTMTMKRITTRKNTEMKREKMETWVREATVMTMKKKMPLLLKGKSEDLCT